MRRPQIGLQRATQGRFALTKAVSSFGKLSSGQMGSSASQYSKYDNELNYF